MFTMMTIETSDVIAAAAACAALFAWIEAARMRRIQERDFNFQRSADIRVGQVQYWADRDLPESRKKRDELRFRVKNVGRAFAAEVNFAVDDRGLLNYVQLGFGLPPGTERELTVVLSPNLELGEQKLLLRYRYDDFRRHWGEIVMKVHDGSHKLYGQYRQPKIAKAKLDGSRNLAMVQSDVFLTPMRYPQLHDPFTSPYRRWHIRRNHPEHFKD